MKYIGYFKLYVPDNPEVIGASYIMNEFGEDWYTIAHDHERTKNKYYAATDADGNIMCITDDGESFFPKEFSAWEIDKKEAPDNILVEGYDATIIDGVYTVNYVKAAETKKNALLSEASIEIAPLQDAVDLEIATEKEVSLLTEWKKYRVLLNRIDSSQAPEITWPTKPHS
ncbi:TPA: tail fiber assembly protein [Klebsiella pneumoniae]|nr:tail fiber assembly protein [Enterobacter cloacae]